MSVQISIPPTVGLTRIGYEEPGVPRSDAWARQVLEEACALCGLDLRAMPNDTQEAGYILARLMGLPFHGLKRFDPIHRADFR